MGLWFFSVYRSLTRSRSLDMPSGWFGNRVTKSVPLRVIHSMFGPFLTLQFSTPTGKNTSTRKRLWFKNTSLACQHGVLHMCVYTSVFCCVGGLVAVVHSFLISVSFAPQAPWSRTIYSSLCHVIYTHTCTQTLTNTPYLCRSVLCHLVSGHRV